MISIRRNPSALWLILSLFALAIPSVAQESAMEQFMSAHSMSMLTADSIDPNHDDMVITALAMQQLAGVSPSPRPVPLSAEPAPQPCVLQIDTANGRAELLSMNGQHLADVHFTLVDSTWYMWLSVDPLADKYPDNSPYLYCGGNPVMLVDPDGREKHNHFSLFKSFPNYQGFENLPDIEDYIIIGAHGLSVDDRTIGMSMTEITGGDEKEYRGANAVVNFIKEEVLGYSNVWKKNLASGEQSVIILNACSTGAGENSLAQQISGILNDVVVVAPDSPTKNVQDPETAIFYQYGPRQKPTPVYENGKLKRDKDGRPVYKWGKVNNWRLFLNGKMIGTIRGNQKLSHECIDPIIKAAKEAQLDTTK